MAQTQMNNLRCGKVWQTFLKVTQIATQNIQFFSSMWLPILIELPNKWVLWTQFQIKWMITHSLASMVLWGHSRVVFKSIHLAKWPLKWPFCTVSENILYTFGYTDQHIECDLFNFGLESSHMMGKLAPIPPRHEVVWIIP